MLATHKGWLGGWAVALVAVGCCLGLSAPAAAQGGYGKKKKYDVQLKSSPKFLEAFRPAVARAAESTLRVQCDGEDRALGVAVSSDGFLLTQLHDLEGKITVKLHDGATREAKLVGAHKLYDLALLKIDAKGLKPVVWGDSNMVPVGSFVASAGPGVDPVAGGGISVAARAAKTPQRWAPSPNSGFLGIGLADEPNMAKVRSVEPSGAAAKAGLKINDVVLSISGKATPDGEALVRTVQRFKVGATIELKVKRGDEELVLKAKLGERPQNLTDRGEMQNVLGSKLSKLRGGHPNILQHDTVLQPTDCGCPLVDLDGNVVGLNICRPGRVETHAIPAEVVRTVLSELMAGKMPPSNQSK